MVSLGIDEVGRGCWAGPLVAAAVLLPISSPEVTSESEPVKLTDSKLLSKKQRTLAAHYLEQWALGIGIGWVWPKDIDRRGLTWAVGDAMRQAVAAIGHHYDEIIIDGNYNYLKLTSGLTSTNMRTVIGGDKTIPAVSAASIVAKVARDTYMADMAKQYPGYGFERHMGYGTKQHIEALKMLGVTDIHRRSYRPIKAMIE